MKCHSQIVKPAVNGSFYAGGTDGSHVDVVKRLPGGRELASDVAKARGDALKLNAYQRQLLHVSGSDREAT